MTTVLVTGARGNTGREVAALLAARPDIEVRGGSTAPETLEAAGVTPIRFDWAAEETWAAALDGVDAVYLARPDVEKAPDRRTRENQPPSLLDSSVSFRARRPFEL